MLHVEAAYKMPPTVLILGFDALETTLVDRWADEGLLPSFARLSANGAIYALANDVDYLPDTLWGDLIFRTKLGSRRALLAAGAGPRWGGPAAVKHGRRLPRTHALLAVRG